MVLGCDGNRGGSQQMGWERESLMNESRAQTDE